MITGDRSLVSGKQGAFYNTLEEFRKYWERIDIICPRSRGQAMRLTGASAEKAEVKIFENVFIHPSPWPLFCQPLWILKKGRQIHRESRPDLMTVHEYPPFYNGIGARLLWSKIRVPYILEIHHIPGYPRAASLKESLYQWFAKAFIKFDASKARAVRVVNQRQVPEFLTDAGVPVSKIAYIPSAYIDLEVFRPMPEIKKKFDLVFAARLEKNKGIRLLLEAIRNIKLQNPIIKLLIIGNGPLKDEILRHIREYKLENNVFLSGWLETLGDVAGAYNSARIFVNPSFNEGGPRVVLEAMACGLPIISTRVGLVPDIVKDGENGLLADWNPAEIAEKILLLLSSREPQRTFSLAGIELIKQFERKSAIKGYAEKLQNLAK